MNETLRGTHGVLNNSNSGVSIPCTLIVNGEMPSHGSYIKVTVDGSSTANTFYVQEGWSFDPDLPKLPTKTGSIIRVSYHDMGARWMLLRDGTWFSQDGVDKTEREMQRWLASSKFSFEVLEG